MRIGPVARRVAAIGLGSVALAGCLVAPPMQEMSDARQAITAAEEAGADRFAPDEIGEARRYLQRAQRDIESESYGPARTRALRAQERAVRALSLSVEAADDD